MQLAKQKPGTKQTEVGVIPADWAATTIGDVAIKVGSGVTPRGGSDNYGEYGRPFVRSQNVGWGHLLLDDLAFISDEVHKTFAATELMVGDVLLNITGASIGRSAIATEELEGGNVNQHVCIIRTDETRTSSKFINSLLLSSVGQRQIDSFQAGGNREGLNFGQIRSMKIPLPPTLAEQEAIAGALSDTDGLIESLGKLIAKKRQVKHGTMQELLTGKRRLPGFSGKWETKRFDQMFSNLRNASNSRSELSPHGEVAYVHYGDIHIHPTAFLNPVALQTFIPRAKVRAVPRLMDGDLLMADASEDTTAIGKAVEITGLNGAEAIAGLHTMALRGNKELLANGFKGYIQYLPKVRNALVSLATGVSVYGITKSGVKAIEVTIPKPAEQTAIAAILSDMDAEIAALETKLTKARQVKQGMMQELLTGRTRLI